VTSENTFYWRDSNPGLVILRLMRCPLCHATILNFAPGCKLWPQEQSCSPGVNFVPWVKLSPWREILCWSSILLNSWECSRQGANKGVNIPPRGKISPLGRVKLRMALRSPFLTSPLAPRGEICPRGVKFTPSFTPRDEHSLLFRRMERWTENFTPRG
jgi:hypothetical protein